MSEEKKTGMTEEEKVDSLIAYNVTKVTAERDALLEVIEARDKEIKDLKLALAKMKDDWDAKTRSKLIDELRKVTEYGIEYLSTCTVDRLEQLIEDYKRAKRQTFKSSGDLGGYSDPYEKLRTMFKFSRRTE